MDGFGSNQRSHAVDQWMEIVNGKGYGVGSNHINSNGSVSPRFQSSIPPPPAAYTSSRTGTPWRLVAPETKRRKRVATYKAYAVERKVKSTVNKGFRWFKKMCSQLVHG